MISPHDAKLGDSCSETKSLLFVPFTENVLCGPGDASCRSPLAEQVAVYYIIYLLTAIGFSPGGSTHLHTNNTQNNTNNNRTTLITNNVEKCGPCPVFASFYPGICLTTEEKARKNHSQGVEKMKERCGQHEHLSLHLLSH
jgi:hypothetical protein